MKRFLLGTLAALLLSSCISHFFIDTDTRLQIDNRLPYAVADLRIYSPNQSAPDLSWIADTIEAGKHSTVYDQPFVGNLYFSIASHDSICGQDTCWRRQSLGNLDVSGGSVLWRLEASGNSIKIVVK